jgi:hypothetical protein
MAPPGNYLICYPLASAYEPEILQRIATDRARPTRITNGIRNC